MAKPFYIEHAGQLSLLISLVSGFVVALALGDVSTGGSLLGGWSAYLLAIGVIGFLVGILWLAAFLRNVRDLHTYLEETSKAAFVKSLDDAEYVAWKLPMKYERALAAKKCTFGIK